MKALWMFCIGAVAGIMVPAGPATIVGLQVATLMGVCAALAGLLGAMRDHDRERDRDALPSLDVDVQAPSCEAPLLRTGPGGDYTRDHQSDSLGELLDGAEGPE